MEDKDLKTGMIICCPEDNHVWRIGEIKDSAYLAILLKGFDESWEDYFTPISATVKGINEGRYKIQSNGLVKAIEYARKIIKKS